MPPPEDSASGADDQEEADDASIQNNENEDDPDTSSAQPDVEPEELVSLNAQSKQDFKRIFKLLNVNFNQYFDNNNVKGRYAITPKANIPYLMLDYGEDPSWFYPSDGFFKTTDLPPKKTNILPPNFSANVATQTPKYFSFTDPKIKELLEAKPLEKAILDSLAFSDSTPINLKSSPHTNLDTLLRSGMYDFLILDKLFHFMFELLEMVKTEDS